MLKIESNLKINGRHWGLQFADGIAYTANASLAAKLLLKGYVVTDWPEARDSLTERELSPTPSSPAQADTVQTVKQAEQPVSKPDISVSKPGASASNAIAKAAKPRTTKPRKKAVKPHAADAG